MSNASSSPSSPEPAVRKLTVDSKRPVSWGPVAAILVGILAFIGAQFLAFIIVGVLAGLFNPSGGDDWLSSSAGQFVIVGLSDIIAVWLLWRFLRGRRNSFWHIGFSRRPVWWDVGRALLGYAAYFVTLLITLVLTSELTSVNTDQCQDVGFHTLVGFWPIGLALLSLVFLQPITEEIVFRGFIFTGLRSKMHFIWAALFTSAAFGALHLLGGKEGEGILWVAGIDTFLLSIVLCFLREKTGALWAPIMVHIIKNSIAFSLLLTTSRC